MKINFMLPLLFAAGISSEAIAQASCDAVLQYTGMSSLRSLTAEESSDLDYYFNCTPDLPCAAKSDWRRPATN
jgi:hypothetical protein